MFDNERNFRNHVARLLESEGHEVEEEFRVPEGYRVDLVARKDRITKGIEVKFEARGISDDLSKGKSLHRLPEFDEIYVAAPRMLISSSHIGFAERLRIGLLGVTETELKWLVKSQHLKPSTLMGGWSLPNQEIRPGLIIEARMDVTNHGEKVIRHLEMFFEPAGPFVNVERGKGRFKRAKLEPDEKWEEVFKIRIKKTARPGKYPLYLACVADNVERSGYIFEIVIPPP